MRPYRHLSQTTRRDRNIAPSCFLNSSDSFGHPFRVAIFLGIAHDTYQHESRLLNAWANDFCAVRGKSAHGSDKRGFVWSNHQHLAFVSVLFPLLVKKVLSDEGLLAMNDLDIERLRRIEAYLTHDPIDFDWDSDETHPWSEANSRARMAVLARRIYPAWS